MSTMIPVTVDWLALREPADARARSRALSLQARRRMPRGAAVIHDLGAGTGSMGRWLAPRLRGPQSWVLHDGNTDLVAAAKGSDIRDACGEAVSVVPRIHELGDLVASDLAGASLVTATTLLDVLTREELVAIVDACVAARAPVLFTLSVTGRVELSPPDPSDRVLEAAFNDHQRRSTDGRVLLGPDAVAVAAELFGAAGWRVRTAATPWRLAHDDSLLAAEWLAGWIGAAVEQRPAVREWAYEAERRRLGQLASGELRVAVHHADLLAWPR